MMISNDMSDRNSSEPRHLVMDVTVEIGKAPLFLETYFSILALTRQRVVDLLGFFLSSKNQSW